jgi:hypothetical protein
VPGARCPASAGEARFSTWLYRIAINEGNRFLALQIRRELLPFDDVLREVPDVERKRRSSPRRVSFVCNSRAS